mgnify:CR=1 FL=1
MLCRPGALHRRPFVETFDISGDVRLVGYVRAEFRREKCGSGWGPVGSASGRRFGRAFVWRPSPEEDALLARDWLLLRDRILVHGEVRASEGEALQIRPKGKNAEDTTRRTDDEGAPTRQLKRGFYLRASFTERVLARSGLAVRRHT